MKLIINNFFSSINMYITFDRLLLLLVLCMLIFVIKRDKGMAFLGNYMLIMSLMAVILSTFGMKWTKDMGHRIFMPILPNILTAYFMTKLYIIMKKEAFSNSMKNEREDLKLRNVKEAFILLTVFLIIASSGQYIYEKNNIYKASNSQKVYDTAMGLAKELTKEKEQPVVVMSKLQGIFIRQYNANIIIGAGMEDMAQSNGMADDTVMQINSLISENQPDMQELCRLSHIINADYIVCLDSQAEDFETDKTGFEYAGKVDNFVIYKNIE